MHAFRYKIVWTLVTLFAIAVLGRLLLSPVTAYAINNWFEQQGLDSQIEDLAFDLLDGKFSLVELRARRDDKVVLKLDRFDVDWSWGPLFDRRIELDSFALAGLEIDSAREPGGGIQVAGINLASEPAAAEDQQPGSWAVVVNQIQLDDIKTCYVEAPKRDYCNYLGQLAWRGPLTYDPGLVKPDRLPLFIEGDFRLDQLRVHSNRLQRSLLSIDSLSLNQLRLETPDKIAVAAIELAALTAFERPADEDAAQISSLDSLRIENLTLTAKQRLEIERVDLQGHDVMLVNQPQGKLETDPWIAAEIQPAQESPDDKATASGFSYAIKKLNYQTDKSIRYRDDSLEQPFLAILNSIELQLEDIDSEQPERNSQVNYAARYADHGIIRLAGSATPLSPKPSFDLEGRIEGLDLRSLSAFTAAKLGHRIKSGQLNADLSLKSVEANLDTQISLTLNQFHLEALSDKDRENLDSSFGFPLNSSLSLLRDRDNKIELTVPITVNLFDPDFDFSDAITTATSKAITAAVINYYSPFGLVTLVDGLFSLATALKFDPVVYPVGSADLAGVESGALDKIASLMQERPGVHVTLCAVTNSEDRIQLLPQTAEIAAADLELDSEQLVQLETLAETRAANVQNSLVERQIAAERLILCAPKHREGAGLAGVEISI